MATIDKRTAEAVAAAIARHLDAKGNTAPSASPVTHASHRQFPEGRIAVDPPDGWCVIEPTVTCVHCGYCRSQGH